MRSSQVSIIAVQIKRDDTCEYRVECYQNANIHMPQDLKGVHNQ